MHFLKKGPALMKRMISLCLLLLFFFSLSACHPGVREPLLGLWSQKDSQSPVTLAFYSNGLVVCDPLGAESLLEVSAQARTARWEYLPEENIYQITWDGGPPPEVTLFTAELQGNCATFSSGGTCRIWIRRESAYLFGETASGLPNW